MQLKRQCFPETHMSNDRPATWLLASPREHRHNGTTNAPHCGFPCKHDAAHTAQRTHTHNKKAENPLCPFKYPLHSRFPTYLTPLVGHPRQLPVPQHPRPLPALAVRVCARACPPAPPSRSRGGAALPPAGGGTPPLPPCARAAARLPLPGADRRNGGNGGGGHPPSPHPEGVPTAGEAVRRGIVGRPARRGHERAHLVHGRGGRRARGGEQRAAHGGGVQQTSVRGEWWHGAGVGGGEVRGRVGRKGRAASLVHDGGSPWDRGCGAERDGGGGGGEEAPRRMEEGAATASTVTMRTSEHNRTRDEHDPGPTTQDAAYKGWQ